MQIKKGLICIAFLVFLSALFCSYNESNDKFIGLYGFDINLEPFRNKSNVEIVSILHNLDIDGIWGGYKDREFTEICKDKGIKVFSEIPLFVGEKYWKEDSTSRPTNAEGKYIEKEKWYAGVCPNKIWIREQKKAEIKKLIQEYDIDGIWLDFIRYPCFWEGSDPKLQQTCFCDDCLNKFQENTGIVLPESLKSRKEKAQWILTGFEDEWIEFKCNSITGYVQQIQNLVKNIDEKIMVGLFSVPWQQDDFEGGIKRITGQDLKALAPYVDVFSPMAYHKICKKNLEWIGNLASEVSLITGKTVWTTVQSMSSPDKLSADEFINSIDTALENSDGVIIFNLSGVVTEDRWYPLVEKLKILKENNHR